MLEGTTQTLVTLQEVRAREIVMVPVPYLTDASSFSAPNVERARAAEATAKAAEATAQIAAEATAKAAEATAQINMQAAFIADLQKKYEAQTNELKVVQEHLKAMATTNAADPNPNPTARRTLALALSLA